MVHGPGFRSWKSGIGPGLGISAGALVDFFPATYKERRDIKERGRPPWLHPDNDGAVCFDVLP